jgi:hypothetical protein
MRNITKRKIIITSKFIKLDIRVSTINIGKSVGGSSSSTCVYRSTVNSKSSWTNASLAFFSIDVFHIHGVAISANTCLSLEKYQTQATWCCVGRTRSFGADILRGGGTKRREERWPKQELEK